MITEFNHPWNDQTRALLIDPYHGNNIDWVQLSTETRVVAIIHKSTSGTKEIDSAYLYRKQEAKSRGYLWGSYHWGVTGKPEEQADHYIDTVAPTEDELIAIDLEDATSNKLMNADEALSFARRVRERIGRYPVLYTNHASAKLISTKYRNTDFAKMPLWYARFKGVVGDFPAGVWQSYTIWQFSSEILLQMTIPGTKADMDVNVFNGTVEQLRANWPLTKGAP